MRLIDFLKKIPNENEINGSLGEWLAKYYSKFMMDALVLHDVLIDGADGYTSQIDLILIGNKGLYIVEVKNFDDAKIYGDTQKTKWSYYKHGKKYEIYSPLKQNRKHIEYMKSFLKEFGDVPCFSIITMICSDFKIIGEINKDNHIDTAICSSLPMMKEAICRIAENNQIVLDDAKKQEIFDYIKRNQYIGRQAREEHKQRVMAYKANIKECNKSKICPYCKAELVLRNGKNGKFLGCSNFPKCKYTTNCEE